MALLILYEDINFGKRQMQITQSAPSLGNFNRITSSIRVVDGVWNFCLLPNYGDNVATLGPGNYPWVEAVGIRNDAIQSVSLVEFSEPILPKEAGLSESNPSEGGLSEIK